MRRLLALALGAALPAVAAYTYYYTDTLTGINSLYWWQNGTLTAGAGGLTTGDYNGGSLISKVAVPGGSNDYEVKATLTLTANGGGYSVYLRASSDARSGPATSGTYYAFELITPTFGSGGCTATAVIYERVNGVVTLLASSQVSCRNGMVLRAMMLGGLIHTYIDDIFVHGVITNSIPTGMPGAGVRYAPASNFVSGVQFGPRDLVAPGAINVQSIASSVNATSLELQWQDPADDANGIGLSAYYVVRDGQVIVSLGEPLFADNTVSPSTTYTYQLQPVDFHFNGGPVATFQVTTPPAGHVDARRIGVRSDGAYWGSAGEQIDTRSGNLNFTLPLLRAQSRGGAGATFALNYNSQLWRKDGSVHWKLGRDTGYGFGWRLLAGSITPYWSYYYSIHHFVFTDSTGAEYRLDTNQSGIWTCSKDGLRIWYDPATYKLYFPDGSFWLMGALSGGIEEDGGTRYPTLIQDSNGNQIAVRYKSGTGAPWGNSSSRIEEIEDVRATAGSPYYRLTLSLTIPTPPFHTSPASPIISGPAKVTRSVTRAPTR